MYLTRQAGRQLMLSGHILGIRTPGIDTNFLDTATRTIANNAKTLGWEGGMVVYNGIPNKNEQKSRRSSSDSMVKQYISNQDMFMGSVLDLKTIVKGNYNRKNESGGQPFADGYTERGTVKASVLSTRQEKIRVPTEVIEMMIAPDLEGDIAEILDEQRKDLKECIRSLNK